jgi:hypothetical protein
MKTTRRCQLSEEKTFFLTKKSFFFLKLIFLNKNRKENSNELLACIVSSKKFSPAKASCFS